MLILVCNRYASELLPSILEQEKYEGHQAAVGPVAAGAERSGPGIQAGGAVPGLLPASFGHPGMFGNVQLSEETLKAHIEWQIESLQNLLAQIEARQAKEAKKHDPYE